MSANCLKSFVKFFSNKRFLITSKVHILPIRWSSMNRSMSYAFKTIGTHNGTFHCDEVLGCYLLKILCKDAEIVRSRDQSILDKCDIVIDVGSVYNAELNRFDHHQLDFKHTMNSIRPSMPYHIKLSSAGLVYCHFGEDIIRSLLGNIDGVALQSLYEKVYESIILEVDGIDNGVEMFDGEPKYSIHTNLSSRIGRLNRQWNHEGQFDETEAFKSAMEVAGKEFEGIVRNLYSVWWPARKLIIESVENRMNVHPSGEIIVLPHFFPWIDHLFWYEEEQNLNSIIKFVLYPDEVDGKPNGNWRIRAVPVAKSSFVSRTPICKKWRGLRSEDLQGSSVGGIIFVHASGFIGGNKTKEGALQMAVESISESKS